MRFRSGTTLLLLVAPVLGATFTSSRIAVAASDTQSPVTVEQAARGFRGLKPVAEPVPCRNDPGVTDTEIRIGGLIPTSGPSATSYGPSITGIEARFNKANAEHELGARRVTFRNLDTDATADGNEAAAKQLVEQDKVFAVAENDSAGDASAEFLYEAGVPVVGWHLGLPAFGTYPNFFGWRNSTSREPLANTTTRSADVFKQLGARRIALVAQDQTNSIRGVEQVREALERKGLKVVYEADPVTVGTTDFGPVAQAIKTSGADGLYTGMDLNANASLSNALSQAGANDIVRIFPGAYDPRMIGVAGMDRAVFGLEFVPFEEPTAGSREFARWLTATDPSATMSQLTAVGWLIGDALVEGIKAAGIACPTRRAFITNLRLVHDYSADGFFEPVDFRTEWNRPYPCAYYVQVQGSAFVPIFGGKPFCASEFITDDKQLKRALQAATAAVAGPADPDVVRATTTTSVAPGG